MEAASATVLALVGAAFTVLGAEAVLEAVLSELLGPDEDEPDPELLEPDEPLVELVLEPVVELAATGTYFKMIIPSGVIFSSSEAKTGANPRTVGAGISSVSPTNPEPSGIGSPMSAPVESTG